MTVAHSHLLYDSHKQSKRYATGLEKNLSQSSDSRAVMTRGHGEKAEWGLFQAQTTLDSWTIMSFDSF